jgi:YegS/Rv2252/BmrU family lipid kinase
MRHKIKLVANPAAGNFAVSKNWLSLQNKLKDILGDFSAELTTKPGDAIQITQRALQEGCETIVAVGGDGTINEIVNGFFENGRLINPEAKLGVIPMGTGGDFIKTLKIPDTPEAAAPRIREGQIKKCDLGAVCFPYGDGINSRYFINIADAGFGAAVVEKVRQSTKALGPFFAYLTGLLRALTTYKNQPMKIKVDDVFESEETAAAVIAANGQFFGGGMWVAPGAKVDDGKFEVIIIGDISRPEIIANIYKIYNGALKGHPKIRYLQGEKIFLHSDSPVGVEADGEQLRTLPAAFEILPAMLNVLV